MEISEEEYKLAKEAHVADCTGGSVHEVSIACASLVSSHMLWTSLVQNQYIAADSFASQFCIYVVPILTCLTIAADYSTWITIGMATIAFYLSSSRPKTTPQTQSNYKSFLTVYRAGTMISTCIAILAVDFQFFPRRFAKVETFGTSLMDVGVGSFVFSSGVVASRAYLDTATNENVLKSMIKSVRSAFPILVLGFARFFLTKGVNYQEHNSEYGLHWNFFITLGFLPPFVTLIGFFRKIVPFSVLGLMVITIYQLALCQGLQEWILNAPRIDLVSANKEGICSFFGYLGIFLIGLECGICIFQKDISKSKLSRSIGIQEKSDIKQLGIHLVIYSTIMWILFVVWVESYPGYYVSRRMANLPYTFWVIAFNLSLISLLVLAESRNGIEGRGPAMLDAININGLFTFLLANILTGSINLSYRTLYANDFTASIINLIYMLIVTAVPWIMWRRYNLRIKF
ncbi:GWT1-domain-containing protein [Thamnidium elegans]|nr:GWT1-domain-containing protein [Thamnidium elegans]